MDHQLFGCDEPAAHSVMSIKRMHAGDSYAAYTRQPVDGRVGATIGTGTG